MDSNHRSPVKDQLVETVLFDFPAEARKRTIGGRRSQPRDLGGDLRRDHNLRDDNDRLGWGRRQAQNGGSPDGGPMVRILLPPAESLVRTCPTRLRGRARGDAPDSLFTRCRGRRPPASRTNHIAFTEFTVLYPASLGSLAISTNGSNPVPSSAESNANLTFRSPSCVAPAPKRGKIALAASGPMAA